MPQNALAPRNNRLLEEPPPVAGVFGPTVIPRQTISDRLDQLSYGLGTGLVNQLKGYRQMALHPIQSTKELASALAAVAQDPRLAVNAMYGMWNKATSNPEGFGQVVGENISPRQLAMNLARKPVMQEITTYHGTPHVFAPEEGAPLGRFRASKIGTGEGAQAYGHGIYVAESPGVAKEYRDRLSTKVTVDGSQLQTIPSDSPMAAAHNMTVRNLQSGMSAEEAIAATNKYWTDAANEMMSFAETHPELIGRIKEEAASRIEIANAANSLKPESFYRDPGSLYTVDLPDPMVERMLDWDKPFSEQPESVRKAFAPSIVKNPDPLPGEKWLVQTPFDGGEVLDAFATKKDAQLYADMMTGRELYESVATRRGAMNTSEALRKLGIPGVRYLDAGSRDSAKGTRNFVIFPGEEQNLSILKRE